MFLVLLLLLPEQNFSGLTDRYRITYTVGMVLCLQCATAVTNMLFGDDELNHDAWFPKAFEVTPARLTLKLERRVTGYSPSLCRGTYLSRRETK
jgi:hypothetical protein